MSSSPNSPAFPSLTALLSQKPQFHEERLSATTSNDLTNPFQVVLQDPAVEEYGVANVIQSSVVAKAAAATAGADEIPKREVARKPRALKDNDGDVEAAVKKPRKPRAKKAEVVDGVERKDSPAPRRRVRGNKTEEQTKLPRRRITKPSIKPTGEKWTRMNETEAAHHYIATTIPKAADVPDSPLENGLLLQEAVKRRLNWTPPRMTKALLGLDLEEASNDISNIMGKELPSSSLLEKFGYNSGDDTRDITQAIGTTGLRKRKLIELVTTNASAQREIPKPKAPPKKKRTITELAIAAYTNDTRTPAATAPLLQYFPRKDATDAAGEVKDSKVPPQARSRSSTKSVVKNSKSAKTISKDPILLSPKSALKQVSEQDFVFGTSSQLARENSPSLLRDLHQAMRESNKVDDPFAVFFESSKCPEPNKETIARNAGRRLWSAASYGPNVKEIEVDVVDLVELPDTVMPSKAKTSISVVRLPGINQHLPLAKDDEWLQVDEDDSSHLDITKITHSIPQVVKLRQPARHLQLEHSSGPNNPSTLEPKSKSQAKSSKGMKHISEKPDFNSYTSIQLAKEIKSYGFKPVKSREQMITLLERCWEGKQKIALGNVGINAAPPKSPVKAGQDVSNTVAATGSAEKPVRGLRKESKSPEPSERPAGRPRKVADGSSQPSKEQANDVSPRNNNHLDTSASCSPIPLVLRSTPKKQRKRGHSLPEEIEDSDSPLTPSPSRHATPHRRTPSLTLRASLSPISLSPASLSPPASSIADSAAIHDDTALYTHITRAIVTAPRAAPPALVPSWHEKILLYDPIVLEDLTAWLNTGALDRVGWDGEISPAQVKRWCIAKGVCCLWRETTRGRARQRL